MSGLNQSFTTDQVNPSAFPTEFDLGFTPKVVFMMAAGVPTANIGTSFTTQAWAGLGWCVDPNNEQTSVGSGGYENGTVPGGSYISDSVFAAIAQNTDTRSKQIDMISYDCDLTPSHADSGYTVQTASATFRAGVVPTIALGGNNILAANGSFSWPGSAGNYSVTGVGFTPQLVMFLWSKTPGYNDVFSSANDGSGFGFGAGDETLEQFALYTTSQGGSTGQADHASGLVCVTEGTGNAQAFLLSMDADGFTLTFSGPDTGETKGTFPRLVGWIALADTAGGFKVGNAVVPGSTGNVAYTGCGFAPDQVILASGNTTADQSFSQTGGAFALGMFDSALQSSILNGEGLIGFPDFSARRHNNTAIAFGDYASGVDAEASRASMDADGFSLNWSNVGAPGKPFGWIAMHTTGDNFPCGPGGFMPQIYRWLKK